MSEDPTKKLSTEEKLDQILERLTTLEAKAYDTKPIWEQALAELVNLREEMRSSFRKIDRRFEVLSSDMIELRASQGDLERRMDKLESPPT